MPPVTESARPLISCLILGVQSTSWSTPLVLFLLGSVWIAYCSRQTDSPKSFLFSRGDGTVLDFIASHLGMNVSVSGLAIVLPVLVLKMGGVAWIGVLGAYIFGNLAYVLLLARAPAVRDYFNSRSTTTLHAFLGEAFGPWLMVLASAATIVSYFGAFGVELLALLKVLPESFRLTSSLWIAAGSMLVCVLYTSAGGYRGTFRSDGLQSAIFVVVMLFLLVYLLVATGGIPYSSVFSVHGFDSSSTMGILLLWLLGITYQITAMDLWVRTGACNPKRDVWTPKLGLILSSALGAVFLCPIAVVAWARQRGLAQGDIERLFARVIEAALPPSAQILSITVLLAVALSTASVALITVAQTMFRDLLPGIQALRHVRDRPTAPLENTSFRHIRLTILGVGVLGVLIPILAQRVVDAFFVFLAWQVTLLPLIFIAGRRRRTAMWLSQRGAVVAVGSGICIAVACLFFSGDVAEAAPLLSLAAVSLLLVLWKLVCLTTAAIKHRGRNRL